MKRAVAVVLLAALAACARPVEPAPVSTLGQALDASAARTGVPRVLLVGIAKVEDGLGLPRERLALDPRAEVPAAGPLQLRRGKLDTLRRGAELRGVSELALRSDRDLALDAGALVLAELGAATHARADDLATWAEAIETMSGFADEPHRRRYAHQVFATLARGGTFDDVDGASIVLPPQDIPPALTLDVELDAHPLARAQFAGAEWIPTSCSNKCTAGRGGHEVDLIVIHDTEGNWNASVATLQNDPEKSVQYIIDVDGRVGQFVTEETTAWHAGNFDVNQRSIGIEHVGYATRPFPEAVYAASAKLVDHLATKYKVPRDRAHVIGHDQVPNGDRIAQTSPPCSDAPKACAKSTSYGGRSNHSDPGVWEWATYMPRIGGRAKCNDVTALWNCSSDDRAAFRCAGAEVEVATCTGPKACETKANGVDDVCDVAPKATTSVPVPAPGTGDLPPVDNRPDADADGGCTAAPARSPGWPSAIAALVILAGARRRRRDHGPRPA